MAGIQMGANFDLAASIPLDSRLQYKTIAEMKNAPETSLYDGLLSYCVEADATFQWKSKNPDTPDFGKWMKFTSGSNSAEGVFISTDYYNAMKESGTLVMDKFYYVSDEFIDEIEAEDRIVLNESTYDALKEAGRLNENTIYYVY